MERSTLPRMTPDSIPIDVLRDLVHDLKNPLVAASGFLTLLQRTRDDVAAERYAASLRESIEVLRQVLDRTHARYCRANTH